MVTIIDNNLNGLGAFWRYAVLSFTRGFEQKMAIIRQLSNNSENSGLILKVMKKDVPKRGIRPKHARSKRESELGLWVDYALLRKHQGRPPETILHAQPGGSDNHYLQLADLALRGKPKKKSVAEAVLPRQKLKKNQVPRAGE